MKHAPGGEEIRPEARDGSRVLQDCLNSAPPVVVASLAGTAATSAGIDEYEYEYEDTHGKAVEVPTPSTVPGLSGEEVAAFDLDLNLNLESFQASLRQEAGEDGNN